MHNGKSGHGSLFLLCRPLGRISEMNIEPVTLEGKYVRLEPMRVDHLPALCKVGLDPSLWEWTNALVRDEADMERYADKHLLLFGGGEPWEQEVLNEIVLDYVRDKIAYFKSLPVPEGDGKEVRAMIVAFEAGLERAEENPASLAEARPFANKEPPDDLWDASYETTSDYGPWLCGQP